VGGWKIILAAAALAALVWFLYPSVQPGDGERNGVPAGEVVEIHFMGPGGPLAGAMADAVVQFERESAAAHAADPTRPIYRVISGQNAARDQVADPTRFLISVAGGEPPDAIIFDRYAVTEWAARDAFSPLDEFISKDLATSRPDVPNPGDYYASCWNETKYKGKVYGIPAGVDDRALLYNKDLLKAEGLVDAAGEARPPADWDELLEYAKKLTKFDGKKNIRVLGFAPLFGNSWLYMFGWLNGGEFMSADGKRCTLNDPKIVEALEFIVKAYDVVGGYKEAAGFQAGFQGGELDPFIQGKVAMKIDGFWTLSGLATYGTNLNFGVAPAPLSPGEIARGKPAMSWNGGWAYAIPSNALHKQAAWEFIKFMTSRRASAIINEVQRETVEAQGRLFIPGQSPQITINEETFEKYIYSNPRASAAIKEGCRVFNRLLPTAKFRPVTPVGQLLWNEHVNATEAALYHAASPKEALDKSTAIVQRDLDRVLSPPTGPVFHPGLFLVVYVALLVLTGTAVYYWDTRIGFRRWLAAALRIRKGADAVIEGSSGSHFRRQWGGGIVCALPWIGGFVVFGGGPMLFSLLMSLCDYDILNPPRFVGLNNYAWMLTQDNLFGLALWNTLYMAIGVPAGMAASLAMAMLLNVKIRGIAVWRTFFYLPSIVPMVAASVLWIWIFNPQGGLINETLRSLGWPEPLWLQNPDWSKPSLILMGLWGAGGGMIIWLAGLKGIDEQLYEAASIDGANAWQKFRHVTLPQLTPYIFFNLVMGLIGTFQIFGQAFIMTQGGPVNSTLFYVYHLFNQAFRYGHMGYASAMAWVLLAIVMVLTIIQFKLAKRWVYYESE
jgi:multiple sugar transport system permease protein